MDSELNDSGLLISGLKQDKKEIVTEKKDNLIIDDKISLIKEDDLNLLGGEMKLEGPVLKENELIEKLQQRHELYVAESAVVGDLTEDKAVGMYKPVDKKKKGRTKRHEDEARLKKLRKTQDITARANHRTLRFVEKWNNRYEENNIIQEQKGMPGINEAVEKCLKWVPSMQMAQEKYLADHTDEVKDFFRVSMVLEKAMRNPDNDAFFASMDKIEYGILKENMELSKEVRAACTDKLAEMGVVFNQTADNITVTYEKSGRHEDVKKDREKYANSVKERRKNFKSMMASKDTANMLRTMEVRIKLGEEQKTPLQRTNERKVMEKTLRDRAGVLIEEELGHQVQNERMAKNIASTIMLLTNMDVKEAAKMTMDLTACRNINNSLFTDPENMGKVPDEVMKNFALAFEKTASVLRNMDISSVDKAFSKDISVEEHMRSRFILMLGMDMDEPVASYQRLMTYRPDLCTMTPDQFIKFKTKRDFLTFADPAVGYIESILANDEFMQNFTEEEIRNMSADRANELFVEFQQEKDQQKKSRLMDCYAGLLTYAGAKDNLVPGDYKASIEMQRQELMNKMPINIEKYKNDIREHQKAQSYKERFAQGEAMEKQEYDIHRTAISKITQRPMRYELDAATTMAYYGVLTDEEAAKFALNTEAGFSKGASQEEIKRAMENSEKVIETLASQDVTLLSRLGRDKELNKPTDEEFLQMKALNSSAMGIDGLIGLYEKAYRENPQLAGKSLDDIAQKIAVVKVMQSYGDYLFRVREVVNNPLTEQFGGVDQVLSMKAEDVAGLYTNVTKDEDTMFLGNLSVFIQSTETLKNTTFDEQVNEEAEKIKNRMQNK